MATERTCNVCQRSLPLTHEFFYHNRSRPGGLSYSCRECQRKRNRAWNAKNKGRCRASAHERAARYPERRKKLAQVRWKQKRGQLLRDHAEWYARHGRSQRQQKRLRVLTAYSGDPAHCVCCGETEVAFLALDHINGGGHKHRKEIGRSIYDWAIDNDFPPVLRVLCHNCNMARAYYGSCPHEKAQWDKKQLA